MTLLWIFLILGTSPAIGWPGEINYIDCNSATILHNIHRACAMMAKRSQPHWWGQEGRGTVHRDLRLDEDEGAMEMTFMTAIQQGTVNDVAVPPEEVDDVGHRTWPSLWTAYRRTRREHYKELVLSCCELEGRCPEQAFADLCLF